MKISDGLLHSPYFIFLEDRLPDHELLRLLGFGNYVRVPLVDPASAVLAYLWKEKGWTKVEQH